MKALTYTKTPPTVAGMWWHLAEADGDPTIVRVFKDADGYWSVQYDSLHLPAGKDWSDDSLEDGFVGGGTDFLENYRNRWWCLIPVPKKPKSPDSVDLS